MINRETDYAIRCVLHLARKAGEVIMVNEISRKNDIPKSFLAKILQKLTKAEIVRSFRGVKGGYQFSKEPSKINLLHVIETIQGPIFLNKCMVDRKACSRRKTCTVHPLWNIMAECLTERLQGCNIEELLKGEARVKAGNTFFRR